MIVNARKRFCLALILFFALALTACWRASKSPPITNEEQVDQIDRRSDLPLGNSIQRDLAEIKSRGTLTVLAQYNSTTYFFYRGGQMGYEYELLREFARENSLTLNMVAVTDRKSLYAMLNAGDGDIVAARLIPTEEDKKNVSFTRALYQTEPALVQQEIAPENSNMSEAKKKALESEPEPETPEFPEIEIKAQRISKPAELSGETVHVPEKSPYKRTLLELEDEISGDIHVVETESQIGDEALAQKVAKGEVDFTVMQDNVAQLKEAEFENLKVRPVVGRSHSVTWAVRKNAPQLLDALNAWIDKKDNTAFYNLLYKKYFVDRRKYRERVASEYLTSTTGKLSEFDPLLRQYASELGWDWRLFASQAFQESRFNPNARSWAGAIGLLQIMPGTAQMFSLGDIKDPEQNVRGAIKFLKWLENRWEHRIADKNERLKFILASYNAGWGHVEDAQRLAEKHGGDPEKWNHVSYWLLQLSTSRHNTEEVVRYGFCRGTEPVDYVNSILTRFEHYKKLVAETPQTANADKPPRRKNSKNSLLLSAKS